MDIIKKLFKYGYHDTDINSIRITKTSVDLTFNAGLFVLDENGNEDLLTNGVTIRIFVDSRHSNIEEAINILQITPKNKKVQINNIKKTIKDHPLGVDNLFFSNFNSTILLECGFSETVLLLSIEDCIDVDFLFKD